MAFAGFGAAPAAAPAPDRTANAGMVAMAQQLVQAWAGFMQTQNAQGLAGLYGADSVLCLDGAVAEGQANIAAQVIAPRVSLEVRRRGGDGARWPCALLHRHCHCLRRSVLTRPSPYPPSFPPSLLLLTAGDRADSDAHFEDGGAAGQDDGAGARAHRRRGHGKPGT